MKAITFAAPIPRYLVTLAAGQVSRNLFVGPHACTRYGDVPAPTLPGRNWVRIRTRLGGICGSDLSIVTLKSSPSTSPFSSFPFVLGHESVGDVVEVGEGVTTVKVGDRVTANPLLCCESRGVSPPCASCSAGQHQRCEHFTDGGLAPGMLIGTTRGVGGSWGEQFVALDSQLVRVTDSVPDEEAVLIEPFACTLHAVRSALPRANERVLVIGGGSIGLLTIAALRAVAPEAHVTAIARHGYQAELARRHGAAEVVEAKRGDGDRLAAIAKVARTRLLEPILGERIGVGGFDTTFVCIGSRQAMEDAMRFTRAGGTIVVIGNVARLNGVDWTPLWIKELTLRGTLCYGNHGESEARDAFGESAELIASRKVDVRGMVTHTFGLNEYRRALETALDKSSSRSVKVAFRVAG